LKAIVVSHPHFYTTHLEWAKQFQCPVYLCKADEEWLNRADKDGMRQWVEGTREIVPGVTAIQAGGHFDGSMVLHWDKKLFIADTMMTVPVS
jgi:glyoxylase-like metal-dependent hydrolase (beta-lactamase superfamily II)